MYFWAVCYAMEGGGVLSFTFVVPCLLFQSCFFSFLFSCPFLLPSLPPSLHPSIPSPLITFPPHSLAIPLSLSFFYFSRPPLAFTHSLTHSLTVMQSKDSRDAHIHTYTYTRSRRGFRRGMVSGWDGMGKNRDGSGRGRGIGMKREKGYKLFRVGECGMRLEGGCGMKMCIKCNHYAYMSDGNLWNWLQRGGEERSGVEWIETERSTRVG